MVLDTEELQLWHLQESERTAQFGRREVAQAIRVRLGRGPGGGEEASQRVCENKTPWMEVVERGAG